MHGVERQLPEQRGEAHRDRGTGGKNHVAFYANRPRPIFDPRPDCPRADDERSDERTRVDVCPQRDGNQPEQKRFVLDVEQKQQDGKKQPPEDLRAHAERLQHRETGQAGYQRRCERGRAATARAIRHEKQRQRRRDYRYRGKHPKPAVKREPRHGNAESPLLRYPRRTGGGKRFTPEVLRQLVVRKHVRAQPLLPGEIAVVALIEPRRHQKARAEDRDYRDCDSHCNLRVSKSTRAPSLCTARHPVCVSSATRFASLLAIIASTRATASSLRQAPCVATASLCARRAVLLAKPARSSTSGSIV